MPFTRFVEVGRVCCINYGPDYGKVCTIVDVVDNNRALVEGPEALTGVSRQSIPFKRLLLTDIKVKIGRSARSTTVSKAWEAQGIQKQWEECSLGKKRMAAAKKASLTDLDRFKVMLAKQKKAALMKKKLGK
uniref:Large ribosomal subunit protein eL14 domain-containing protein n=1 Tax=Chromera velia CCMP2878 TaxID=1169474 RepID=A0A0G4HJT4_9ALVE|mmetsp:Transcript_8991/g.17576  ORF Transcript_8991/g.17576 Transcript_8991/m.17576 type:complete len:132 (-) Transcript_8991:253-648(-)|eukprot:Cvel_7188.t1-p1 / transcript=Cvel_7188.t1 / gene=Cvel_7188 / organism=Chromera_velia_CCMP2878 / gene_product=60S ribosomal protein L14, putative / transcript_product=60S ribosomal protein L14, putative / location=Cvel_scaffold369:87644-90843(+) / protein_length=131 / sequence_SO=supercontig / SO=protein_coding / is_pseudo=false